MKVGEILGMINDEKNQSKAQAVTTAVGWTLPTMGQLTTGAKMEEKARQLQEEPLTLISLWMSMCGREGKPGVHGPRQKVPAGAGRVQPAHGPAPAT